MIDRKAAWAIRISYLFIAIGFEGGTIWLIIITKLPWWAAGFMELLIGGMFGLVGSLIWAITKRRSW